MAHQIDKLSDLDVVNGELGLVRSCNHQILLFRAFAELHVPRRYTPDVAARENRVR